MCAYTFAGMHIHSRVLVRTMQEKKTLDKRKQQQQEHTLETLTPLEHGRPKGHDFDAVPASLCMQHMLREAGAVPRLQIPFHCL